MYITHSFAGTKKGDLDYLIFYLTEEYIEDQVHFTQRLQPMLNNLGENLLNRGAVVQTFRNKINENNQELSKKWEEIFKEDQFSKKLYNDIDRPALLILNSEISEISDNNFLLISLQDFEDNGNFDVCEINNFFQTLIEIVRSDMNLIEKTKEYIKKRNLSNAKKIMNVNPQLFGIGINGREALKAFRLLYKA